MSDRLASDRLALRRELRRELWRRGEVVSLLCRGDAEQEGWVRRVQTTNEPNVWLVGRQRGKSFAALALACETCVRGAGSIVRYAMLTGKSARAAIVPTLALILADCPDELRPKVSEEHGVVQWRNGSTITWAGTDNEQFDRLRGPRAHLVILDESAFYADLERVEAALLPQLTTTNGKVLYLSTPPETPAHPFLQRYQAARANGVGVHATIHSNPRLGPAGVQAVVHREASRLGYTDEEVQRSTYWRREYLAEVVAEESRAALPSWDEAAQRECVLETPRPPHFDAYVSFDWGWQPDPSFGIWGWHDVASSRIVVEEECEWRAKTLSEIAADAKAIELRLYGADRFDGTLLGAKDFLERTVPDVWLSKCISDKAPRQPYLRVGDNDVQLLAEMSGPHGYAIMPTDKADKHLQVDNLNMLIRQRRLIVHPRCKRLLAQMSGTLWNKARTEWERTSLDHGEGVDCLVYLGRNVRWHRDCRPVPPRDVFVGAQVQSTALTGLSALASGLTGRRF
jgi:hypothetical protein